VSKTSTLILVAVLFHVIAAICSIGYHHPDEHYQILEFANAFLGRTPYEVLPWEFAAKIRPWFQPLAMAGIFSGLSFFGIESGVDWALFTRILYSLLNLLALHALSRAMPQSNPKSRMLFWFFAATLWFFPYVHARTSAENLAGILFTFALAKEFQAVRTPDTWRPNILSGVLCGLAFVVRPQMALAIFGFGLSRLMQKKIHWRNIAFLCAGFILVLPVGLISDRIGYGEWLFTPLKYFDVNLVQGVAATFNPYPWYQYFIWLIQLNPVVNIGIGIAAFVTVKKRRFDPSVLAALSFFLAHMALTNKEYRFLFPLLNFVPYWFAMATADLQFSKRRVAFTISIWLFLNLPAYFVSGLRSAAFKVWPYAAAHEFERNRKVDWISNINFRPEPSSSFRFYDVPGPPLTLFRAAPDLAPLLASRPTARVMLDILLQDPARAGILDVLREAGCEEKKSALPSSILDTLSGFPFSSKLHVQAIYSCNPRSN
jgi:GPI mannosyltransferase 3